VKTTFLLTVCAASLLAFSAQQALAQQRPTGPPSSGQPGTNQPTSNQPGSNQPGSNQPGAGQPGLGQPQGQPPVGGGPAGAQRHNGSPAMHNSVVAVIDLNFVMNNYINAKKQVDDLQKTGMAADNELRKTNAEIEMLKEDLKNFKPGTADYKRKEEEVTQRMSDLKVRASFEQRDFQERQMKAMYIIYREITDEVKRYAQANSIGLVMDYSRGQVDINVPATIQREVTKPFVYQAGPDITDAVLNALNQRAVASKPPTAGGGGGGGAPGNTRR
jgi:Skp family chaperone for outer membrane proteins